MWRRLLGLLAVGAGVAAQDGSGKLPELRPLDGVAAVVNGEVITWSEVRAAVGDVYATLGYATREERLRRLGRYALLKLRDAVERRLMLQTARAAGIRVSDAEVDRLLEQERAAAGSPQRFLERLAAEGKTLPQFRQELREELLRTRYLQAQAFATPWGKGLRRFHLEVRPCELRRYYREHPEEFRQPARAWLRRAVISAEEAGGDGAARELAAKVVRDLRRGVAPGEVNARYGLGAPTFTAPLRKLEPVTPESGLREAVRRFAFSAPVGAVSDPIPLAPGTWGVCVLVRREAARILPFEQVQDRVRRRLLRDRERRATRHLYRLLFEGADVRPEALGRWLRGEGPPPRLSERVLAGILTRGA